MEQAKIENRHRATHRFLADRYYKATPERRIFYKKMMEMNDCRMIEEMRALHERKKTDDKKGHDGC